MSTTDDLKSKLSLPLIMAPMFLVSNPELAIAACQEGVVGSFPALNQRTSAGLEQWLIKMNQSLDDLRQKNPNAKIAPYAVNLIVNKTNTRLQDDLDLCVKYKVPIIITSLGASTDVINAIHAYGGIVLHDVTNIVHAKKAVAAGVDGLIAVASGAGGHAGTMNPIALVREIREFYDGFIALAGCITTGRDILSAEALGADVAYMGTRFISTVESSAQKDYKQMLCDAVSSDIVYTSAISGIPANFLRQSMEKAGFNMEQIKKEGANAGKLKSLESEGDAWKDIWSAGQGVSSIHDTPTVKVLADRLKQEYADAQKALLTKFSKPSAPPKP